MTADYLKQKKILLVDDEKEIIQMITEFLQEDGYMRSGQPARSWKDFRQCGSGSQIWRSWM